MMHIINFKFALYFAASSALENLVRLATTEFKALQLRKDSPHSQDSGGGHPEPNNPSS